MARKKDKAIMENQNRTSKIINEPKESEEEVKRKESIDEKVKSLEKASVEEGENKGEVKEEKVTEEEVGPKGLLTVVKVSEEVKVKQDHDGNIKAIAFSGKLNLENPSKNDRLFDIDVALQNIEHTTLKSGEINVRELGIDESNNIYTEEYQISKNESSSLLLIKEYINTLSNADDVLNFSDVEKDLIKLKEKTGTVVSEKEFKALKEPPKASEGEKESKKKLKKKPEATKKEQEITPEKEQEVTPEKEQEITRAKAQEITPEKALEAEPEEQTGVFGWLSQLITFRKSEETEEGVALKEKPQVEAEPKVEDISEPIPKKEEELREEKVSDEKKQLEEEPKVEKVLKPVAKDEAEEEEGVVGWFKQLLAHRESEAESSESVEEKEKAEEEKKDELATDGGESAETFNFESFGIVANKPNAVTFVIAARSLYKNSIRNVRIVKNAPPEFKNLIIKEATLGTAKLDNNELSWIIDELPPETTIFLRFSAEVETHTLEPIKTGSIDVSYIASSSFTGGIDIERFRASTRSGVSIDMIEKEERPGLWDCNLVFDNISEFLVQLLNVDVYSPKDERKKFVTIDSNNLPIVASRTQWTSRVWEYESEGYPSFNKKVDFTVLPDFQTDAKSLIALDEVSLILASIGGTIAYEVTELPVELVREANVLLIQSYKATEIRSTLKVLNNGSAPLNQVIIEQKNFSDAFQPPNFDEIKVFMGEKEIELNPEAVEIKEHSPKTLLIALKNLKDGPLGMFEPNSTIEVRFPVHAVSPPRDAEFRPEVVYRANTYPLSQEVEYIPTEIPIVKVIHIRRKYRVGKEIVHIRKAGTYKIILLVENLGNMPIKAFTLMDIVPEKFEGSEYSIEPEILKEKGQDILKWSINTLEEGKKIEISYEIKGSGTYSPKDAQLSL